MAANISALISFLLRSLLPRMFRRGPYRLNLAITKECHSRCSTCNIWNLPSNRSQELSISEFEKIAQNFPSLRWLSITGGEPTDRLDLPLIVDTFTKRTPLYLVNLSTNGLHRKRIIKIVEAILKTDVKKVAIAVSVDGPADIHDEIRGIKGGHNLALETLAALLDMKQLHPNRLNVFASMTVQKKNQNLINDTLASLSRLRHFEPHLLHFNFIHHSPILYKNEEVVPTANSNSGAQRKVRLQKSFLFEILESVYLKNANEYLTSGAIPISCEAISNSLHIDETGNVYPCTIWDKNLGNLRTENYSVKTIIEKENSRKIEAMAKNRDCPNCWSPCEAYQSIAANPLSSIWSVIRPRAFPSKSSRMEIESSR